MNHRCWKLWQSTIAVCGGLALAGCGSASKSHTAQVASETRSPEVATAEPFPQSFDFTMSEHELTSQSGKAYQFPPLEAPMPEMFQPELPKLPEMPGMVGLPGMPEMAAMPGGLPGLPGGANLPVGFAMPGMPNTHPTAGLTVDGKLPVFPEATGATTPSAESPLTRMPQVPPLPALLKAPEMPRLAPPPDMRKMMLESMRAAQTGPSLSPPVETKPISSKPQVTEPANSTAPTSQESTTTAASPTSALPLGQ